MPSAKEPTLDQTAVHGLDRITPNPPTPNPPATAPPHGAGTQAPDGTGTQTTALLDQSPSNQSLSNRLLVLMAHTSRYAFRGQARLAADAGVSRSTISRLLRGRIRNPSYALVCAVTHALERHLDRRLDPRELIAPGGAYPTPSSCALAGCRGCMPDEAYEEDGTLRTEYQGLRPGEWSLARASDSPQTNFQQTNNGKENR